MDDVLTALAELLEQERQAALRADFDALTGIQEQKREAMDRAEALGGLDSPELARLTAIARANVGLLRQLVVLTRALAGIDSNAGYGADGREQSSQALPSLRGSM